MCGNPDSLNKVFELKYGDDGDDDLNLFEPYESTSDLSAEIQISGGNNNGLNNGQLLDNNATRYPIIIYNTNDDHFPHFDVIEKVGKSLKKPVFGISTRFKLTAVQELSRNRDAINVAIGGYLDHLLKHVICCGALMVPLRSLPRTMHRHIIDLTLSKVNISLEYYLGDLDHRLVSLQNLVMESCLFTDARIHTGINAVISMKPTCFKSLDLKDCRPNMALQDFHTLKSTRL